MQRHVTTRSGLMCPLQPGNVLGTFLMGASLALGCTEYEPASDTLPSTTENPLEGLPPALGADWSCLGTAQDRAPAPGMLGAPVVYSLRLVDLATQEPVPDVVVDACALTDITCNAPVASRLTPDAEGWVNVPLTSNFTGYLEIESPGTVPYLFHLPDDGIRTMRDFPLLLIDLESFGALQQALRIQADPTLGAIAMRAFDCQGNPAPGVALQTNSGGVPFYFENGLPNTTRRVTDAAGLAGFIGAVPGVTLLESELANGTTTSTKSLIIRSSWMTSVFMRPAQGVVP
jgi:hypothetical protein